MTHELELQTIAPEDLENVNAGFLRYAAPAAEVAMTGLKYGATGLKYGVKGLGYGFRGILGATNLVMTGVGMGYAYSIVKPIAGAAIDATREKFFGYKKPPDKGPEIVE